MHVHTATWTRQEIGGQRWPRVQDRGWLWGGWRRGHELRFAEWPGMRARPPYLGEAAPVDIEHATLLERLVGLKLSDTNKVNLMIIIDFYMNTR